MCLETKAHLVQLGDCYVVTLFSIYLAPLVLQVQESLATLELFDTKMKAILQERAQLAASIQMHLDPQQLQPTQTPAQPDKQQQQQQAQMQTQPAMKRTQPSGTPLDSLASLLSKNIHAEQDAHNCMSDYLCTRVLSPLQLVKAAAASFPYVPDVSAVLRSIKHWKLN